MASGETKIKMKTKAETTSPPGVSSAQKKSILLEDERKHIKKEEEEERMLYKEHGPLYIIENGDNGESIKLRIKKKQSEKGRHFVVKSVRDSPTYQGMDQSAAEDLISRRLIEEERQELNRDKRPFIEEMKPTSAKEVGGYKKRRKTRRKRKTNKKKKKRRRKSRRKGGHHLLGGGI